jgi:hypothetical protein
MNNEGNISSPSRTHRLDATPTDCSAELEAHSAIGHVGVKSRQHSPWKWNPSRPDTPDVAECG